jgi:CBS domain-containing protein
MKIRELMSVPVSVCRAGDSLESAARQMWSCDIGALPVVDDVRRVVGMITDRDLCMAALHTGRPLAELRVEGAMAREPIACGPDDAFAVARELMAEHQLHRLPVVDRERRLVGIVTLNDLALEADHERSFSSTELRPEDVAFVLAAIGSPRVPRPDRRAAAA